MYMFDAGINNNTNTIEYKIRIAYIFSIRNDLVLYIVLIGLNFTLHRRPHLYIHSRSLFSLSEEAMGLIKMSRSEVSSAKRCGSHSRLVTRW